MIVPAKRTNAVHIQLWQLQIAGRWLTICQSGQIRCALTHHSLKSTRPTRAMWRFDRRSVLESSLPASSSLSPSSSLVDSIDRVRIFFLAHSFAHTTHITQPQRSRDFNVSSAGDLRRYKHGSFQLAYMAIRNKCVYFLYLFYCKGENKITH